ncbi:MAG: PD40 domain-containing protein [Cyanobacteria bacterium HKST-UBA02]|nr:PD40 domain-containing protein [Cyanobacteria bacterium HKST-UBA02]
MQVKWLTRTLGLFLLTFALSGCDDIDRIVWSSDGKIACVLAADGLRLTDGGGALSPVAERDVRLARWAAGSGRSKRLFTVTSKPLKTWPEIEKIEDAENLDTIKTSAAEILMRADLSKGDWEKFTSEASDLPFLAEAAILADHQDHKKLKGLFGGNWDKSMRDASLDVYSVNAHDVDGSTVGEGRTLLQTAREVVDLYPQENLADSQNAGRALAVILKPEPHQEPYPHRILVLDAKEGKQLARIEGASKFPSWSPDGTTLYYIGIEGTGKASDSLTHMGSLKAAVLFDRSGELLPSAGDHQVLARLIFGCESRVKVRKNGDIVFSSHDVTLPCVPSDFSHEHTIYTLSPGKRATVARLFPRRSSLGAGNLRHYFEFNPSETRVSLPDKEGFVTVVDLATGELTVVDGDGFTPADSLKFLPHWLSDDVICLPGSLDDNPGQGTEVVLYDLKEKKGRSISRDWPKAATSKFLE